MAGDGAHQRAGLALRAQRGVDLPGRLVADPHEGGGDPGGAADSGRASASDRVDRLGHEDDVDVADVVELAPAASCPGR